jgi:hypothetical protein
MDLTMIIFSLYFVKILKISSWTIHLFLFIIYLSIGACHAMIIVVRDSLMSKHQPLIVHVILSAKD